MEHRFISHPIQCQAEDSHDPASAHTAIRIGIPESFSEKAMRVIDYFGEDATLFLYKGRFVLTDEAMDLGEPRWVGENLDEQEAQLKETLGEEGEVYAQYLSGISLGELEAWLEAVCDEYDANYAKYPGWISLNDPTQWD